MEISMSILRIFSAVFELSGIFITLLIIMLFITNGAVNKTPYRTVVLCMIFNIAAMASDLLALYLRYETGALNYYGVRIANFLGYFCSYTASALLYAFFSDYIDRHVKISRMPKRFVYVFTLIMDLLLVVNCIYPIFYDFTPQYTRGRFFVISQLPAFVIIGICLFYMVKYRNYLKPYERFTITLYFLLPVAAVFIQMNFYGLAITGFAGSVSGSIMFLFLQMDQEREMARKERDLMEQQIAVSVSQIQPHFISNAMNTIQYLCITEPEQAAMITGKFAEYLRMNINSYSICHPIDFTEDLKHLDLYLSIQRLRFPDIQYIYHIEAEDFQIPPITLQPLVENAINHGVRKLEENGVIEISTERDGKTGNAVVRIRDNGVGFDPMQPLSNDRAHLGIANTRERLKLMCRGTLEIQSRPGEGTLVTLTIPN